ncbi:MAG: two-component sensor histidine kinase [Alphaproteobacteria bacterium]|nr:two-component sensor histidine kinase [Alphaproteobacteria bacterium]MBU1605748.1 two-component sensor histidine kinase [Alphaproteobacteria bacterium]
MPSDRTALFHSAALRGAIWITLIALATTGFALTVQFAQTMRLLEQRNHALVDDEAASLLSRYRAAGLQGVARAVRQEGGAPRLNEFFYLLATPGGRPLAGNLVEWPREVNRPGYHRFETRVASSRAPLRERNVEARAIILPDGYRLLVGNLSDERMVLRDRYLSALVWSLLATGILGLALGFWYSRRGLFFVQAASDAGNRFLRGKLDERLPVSARRDEYDRLARTLNTTFEEIERLIGSLRAATEGLAHDLRTPITRIRARLELAEMQQADAEQLHAVMAESREDLDAILRLIEDILELARAEAIAEAGFAPLRLDAIVAEAVELYEPLAEERGLRLQMHTAPAQLSGSRSLLARMVTNLLDNAIKYSPQGGRILVAVEATEQNVVLSVADEGPGVPEAQREKVLYRFARLDPSRSQPGSGIGLSIVAAAVRAHRAELELQENNPGLRVVIRFSQTRRS